MRRGGAPLRAALACLLLGHGTGSSTGPMQLWAAPRGRQEHGAERDGHRNGGLLGLDRGRPLRGLGPAQSAVRAALATAEGRQRGVAVTLLAGVYDDGPLRLSAADSGTAGAPVTWRGEPGALLSGGVEIPTPAWSRAGAGAVWQANLTALGLPEEALGVVGQGTVLDGRGEASAFAELFYGGAAATLARWPNKAADGSTVYAYTWSGVCGGPLVRGGCKPVPLRQRQIG